VTGSPKAKSQQITAFKCKLKKIPTENNNLSTTTLLDVLGSTDYILFIRRLLFTCHLMEQ